MGWLRKNVKNKGMGKSHDQRKTIVYNKNWGVGLREQIWERDLYKCRNCGKTQRKNKEKLTVHHIDYTKSNSVPANLISLCWDCHTKCHTKTESRREEWIAVFKKLLPDEQTQVVKSKGKKELDTVIPDLRAILKKLKISPNKMTFFLEYIQNGGKGAAAYRATHPNVTGDSAKTMAARWIKDIELVDLLTLFGLGYGQIIEDLKELSPKDRLYFLMKFHKLDNLQIESRNQLEVTVIPPPKLSIPNSVKIVDVKKRVIKDEEKIKK